MTDEHKANILLVDDRPENLAALESILEPLGHNLVRATSGEEALKRLLRDDFALILLDVEMPGIDGFETAEHIKSRERSKHIPIIFLTALDEEDQRALRGYSAGAVDYLYKPFNPVVLRSKVQVFIDLWRLNREAEELAHRALHDPLTGLPNRVLFHDRLEMALARARRKSSQVAVLFLDLDGFKLVNDRLGHEAGDQLLVEVAHRLQQALRPSDTVARFGGDEFTVLSEGFTDERHVLALTERIQSAIAERYELCGGEAHITTSIGVALASGPDARPETLIREADSAMYCAKRHGGSRHELVDGSVRRRAAQRVETERALERAIEREQFRVHYQPKCHLESGAVAGFEALVRWEHPQRGLLAPIEFIPLAEETGLIVPLGTWVLHESLRQIARWRVSHPERRLTMCVNMSARQLAPANLADAVDEAIRAAGLEPAALCLEVTESVAMDDPESMIVALRDLKAVGVRLAIDDFGTGYSSLAYLKSFPVDILKLDRSFVQGLGEDQPAESLAGGIVSLAHALELDSIAEGVETAAQLDALRALGCDFAQGYYFSPPKPPEELEDLLRRGIALDPAGNARAAPAGP